MHDWLVSKIDRGEIMPSLPPRERGQFCVHDFQPRMATTPPDLNLQLTYNKQMLFLLHYSGAD